jgi:AbrB family looped-hinge helix DNA binding protein
MMACITHQDVIYNEIVVDVVMSVEFQGTLVKWGTSVGLAIPKPIRDGMNLKAGDKIRILLRDNMICVQKVK